MFYIGITGEIIEELPTWYANLSDAAKVRKEVCEYIDKGAGEETVVKGVIDVADGIATQSYITLEKFLDKKHTLIKTLNKSYESRIDLIVRKVTQDLAFGDINEIPQSVIGKRETLKKEYHTKKDAIKNTESVPELNAIQL